MENSIRQPQLKDYPLGIRLVKRSCYRVNEYYPYVEEEECYSDSEHWSWQKCCHSTIS